VNTYIFINLITLVKLLKRYKLTSVLKQLIIKAKQKKSSTWHGLNRLARKIDFKESNKNNQL
tara:strand:- start:252 stop:437 length:186 start_codon:yes stop_codon:yes gene_type:complete